MIEYEYICTNCENSFSISQSIKDKPLVQCEKCQSLSLERVIFGGLYVFTKPGITTIGKQAEVNSKKMGKYKLSEISEKQPKSDGKFVYTNKETRKKINKMTPQQVQKYIIEGK